MPPSPESICGKRMSASQDTVPPLYDEIDYILRPERKMDIKTFLLENPDPLNEKIQVKQRTSPPDYNCTVLHYGTVDQKPENLTDDLGLVQRAGRRKWTNVFAILRGTKLEIYRTSNQDLENSLAQEIASANNNKRHARSISMPEKSSLHAEFKAGRVRGASDPAKYSPTVRLPAKIREYSMRGAVAGVASDYIKRENVLRVRAENHQFLFQCKGSQDVIGWLEAIQKSANISEPLESRKEPRVVTTPSRRRRLNTSGRSQPYEVFEAADAEAPLRQRSRAASAYILGHRRRDSVRPVEAIPEASAMDLRLIRALSALSIPVTEEASAVHAPPDYSVSRGIELVRKALHVTRRSTAEKSRELSVNSGKRTKTERYVLPLLPASHPWHLSNCQGTLIC